MKLLRRHSLTNGRHPCPPAQIGQPTATDIAAIRRGLVTTMRILAPRPQAMASSRMYSGHWVNLLELVPPDTTSTRPGLRDLTRSRRTGVIGSASCAALILPRLPSESWWASSTLNLSSARNVLSRVIILLEADNRKTVTATLPLPPTTSLGDAQACGAPSRPQPKFGGVPPCQR